MPKLRLKNLKAHDKPSIFGLINLHVKSLAIKIAVFSIVPALLLVALGIGSATYLVSAKTLSATEKWLTQAVLMGDVHQIKRQIGSFLASDVFDGVWLTSHADNSVIAFESKIQDYAPDLKCSKNYWVRVKFEYFGIELGKFLGDPSNQAGCIIIAKRFPISWIMVTAFSFVLVIGILAALVASRVKQLSIIIGSPIKEFADDLHKLSTSSLAEISIQSHSLYKELDLVVDTFLTLWTQSKASANLKKELAEQTAIAKTTQMLAHDVRKPFSMLKTGLNLLQATADDQQKFEKNLDFLMKEVNRAIKSVDGMLTDVMEIGSTSTQLLLEPATPEALIEVTLGEIFRVYPQSEIAVSYEMNHSAMVNVHVKKINRVFSNIVGNAVQAMNYSGSLWFKTSMNGDFVQFCIGNSGSLIPQESLSKLFEAFFTSGKKGGTGLGLAIAQKVVQAHGGRIWCESLKSAEYSEGKVEFFFTLPVAQEASPNTSAKLPKHSREITQMIALIEQSSKSKSDSEFNKSESLLQQELVQRARVLSRPLGLLIVDDESIYRSALAGWILELPEVSQLCQIYHASDSVGAFDALGSNTVDLIITDIDMGPQSLCGFELVKELRARDFKGMIFVHSNRIVLEDHRRAGDLGANGFLPKPMAKGQLFKLLLQTIQWLYPLENAVTPASATDLPLSIDTNPEAVARGGKSPYNLIAIIDDEDIFRDQWPAFLKGFDTACYATAEDFVKDWDRVGGNLVAVLTDKYLGSGMDGIKLATMLRQKAPDLCVILSTSDLAVKDTSNIFDMIVDKDAFEEAPKITEYLRTKTKEEGLPSLMRKTIRAFDSQARDLDENPDFTSVIDSHLVSWQVVLENLDQATQAKLKVSMAKTEKDRLKHDIKGSITRIKILLRYIESGDMDLEATKESLRSRAEDLANI